MPARALLAVDQGTTNSKAVLVADGLGDIDKHPAYEQFKAMSFRAIQPFSEGKLTDEMLAKLDADLAKVK